MSFGSFAIGFFVGLVVASAWLSYREVVRSRESSSRRAAMMLKGRRG